MLHDPRITLCVVRVAVAINRREGAQYPSASSTSKHAIALCKEICGLGEGKVDKVAFDECN